MSIDLRERARIASRARWDREDHVDARVDALADSIARKLDALPPLTDAQRAKLAALLRPEGGASR